MTLLLRWDWVLPRKSLTKCLVGVIIFLSALNLVSPLAAKTLHVPGEYDSIQKAIDISDKGDTIKVARGVYYENITLGDGRDLLGSGADKTIITDDGEGPPDPIIEIDGNCTVRGFTITGARGAGIGHALMVTRGAPRIIDNIVRDNSYTGIGIHSASHMTDPFVSRNMIYGNGGAGIANLGEFSKAIIRDNDIYSNTNVGIACTDSAAPLIDNNRIFANGVGIATKDGAKVVIQNNSVVRNKLVGMVVLKEAMAVIKDNKINENGTVGINVEGDVEAWIISNEVMNNGTEGISIKKNSKAYIAFNVLVSNVSIVLNIRNSQVTAVRNDIHSSEDPRETVSKDFLAEQGIDIDHDHQVSGFGPGVMEVKDSSIAVGGNKLGGKINKDLNSELVIIPPEELPSSPEDIELPQYKNLGPMKDILEEQLTPPPNLKLLNIPKKTKPLFSGCLGIL